ncbi:MAG: hypothetical protein IKK84_00180 [Clostridia bacterium]|nr:hypothetical protein [Clostridia bacterium]
MNRYSQHIETKKKDSRISNMVVAMQGWNEKLDVSMETPKDNFGIKIKVVCGDLTVTNDKLDVEFDVPFDDDLEKNEAEIVIYNMAKNNVARIKKNQVISINCGYGNDTGVIFTGRVSKVLTKWEGQDKKTTIYALDSESLDEVNVKSLAFAAGSKASYILKSLAGKLSIPLAVCKTRRDHTYKDKVTVDGNILPEIKKYAEVCGVSAYINKGKLYIRHISDGDNINFTVQESSGLIGSPEEFEEEITAEDYKDTVTGYNVKMLLQHRITTASIITLKSRDVSGKFRVIEGSHSYNGTDFITSIKVI